MKAIPKETDDKQTTAFSRGVLGDFYLEKANNDLRSPFYNLIHFLHLKKENPQLLDDQIKANIEKKTMKSAENLVSSMEDMLLWSKSQMENFKPEAKNISIDTLFQDTKNHFLGIENIAIHFENLEKLQFISDENYLKTIIRNLTGNCIKALEKTQNATINWKAWYENGQNYLAITDRAEHKNNSKRCMMTQKSSGLKPDWACT